MGILRTIAATLIGLVRLLVWGLPSLVQAGGQYALDFRARAEQVEDDRLETNAHALTYRLHAAAQTPLLQGLTLGTGLDVVRHVGAAHYNDGVNGHAQYPDVNDPDAEEVDEFYLGYKTNEVGDPINIWAGRKSFSQGNNRFISGGLAWRQNGQSFDGFGLSGGDRELRAEFVYLSQALRVAGNRSFKGRQHLNAPVLGLVWTPAESLAVELSAHRLRYVPGGPIPTSSSTQAVTASLKGKGQYLGFQLQARTDLARQRSLYRGTSEVGGDYYAIETSIRLRDTELQLKQEVLEGNGTASFQTPLASLHAFNGYADRFLKTPKDGLRDTSIALSQQFGRYRLLGRAHRFDSTVGDYRYGTEIDLVASVELPHQHKLLLKWADFQAAGNNQVSARSPTQSFDVCKLWFQWEWRWKSQ